MAERGVVLSHTTIMRWVIRYVPEFEKRWNRFSRSIGSSWRVDETYLSIKGKWHYLYRAVDKQGRTVDFMLRPDRGIAAAQAFFRKALALHPKRAPRKITLDGHVPSHRALKLLRHEHSAWRRVRVCSCLNSTTRVNALAKLTGPGSRRKKSGAISGTPRNFTISAMESKTSGNLLVHSVIGTAGLCG
jgi:transposase-like protein